MRNVWWIWWVSPSQSCETFYGSLKTREALNRLGGIQHPFCSLLLVSSVKCFGAASPTSCSTHRNWSSDSVKAAHSKVCLWNPFRHRMNIRLWCLLSSFPHYIIVFHIRPPFFLKTVLFCYVSEAYRRWKTGPCSCSLTGCVVSNRNEKCT